MLTPIYHPKNDIHLEVRKTIRIVYDYEFASDLRDVEIMKVDILQETKHIQYETYIKLLVQDVD